MYLFFIFGVVAAIGGVYAVYFWLQQYLSQDKVSIDDAKGYLLIASIVVAFVLSTLAFLIGQSLGFDQQEELASSMALSILLNIMAILLTLIFGMLKLKQPEHY